MEHDTVKAENTLLNIIDITETMLLNLGFCLADKAPPIIDLSHLSNICLLLYPESSLCKNPDYLQLVKKEQISNTFNFYKFHIVGLKYVIDKS